MKFFCFIFLVFALNLNASGVSDAVLKAKRDVEVETKKLITLRKKVMKERTSLSDKLSAVEEKVIENRNVLKKINDAVYEKDSGFQALSEDTEDLRNKVEFCLSLVTEYRAGYAGRSGRNEAQELSEKLSELDRLAVTDDLEEADKLVKGILGFCEKRNYSRLGGISFTGKLSDAQGLLHKGRFACFGPFQFFLSEKGSISSSVRDVSGSKHSSVGELQDSHQLEAIFGGKVGMLSVDPTGGRAIDRQILKKSVVSELKDGGKIMYPILILGFLSLLVLILKSVQLTRLKTHIDKELEQIIRFVNLGHKDEAAAGVHKLGRPFTPILLEGIYHSESDREHIEEIMHEKTLAQIPFLERGLSLLAVSAAAAPLLGLLGTVTGMIRTFKLVTFVGTGKAKLLSSGISEALITTKYGLLVAIPALLAHTFLLRKVKKIVAVMDRMIISFINGISGEKHNGK